MHIQSWFTECNDYEITCICIYVFTYVFMYLQLCSYVNVRTVMSACWLTEIIFDC